MPKEQGDGGPSGPEFMSAFRMDLTHANDHLLWNVAFHRVWNKAWLVVRNSDTFFALSFVKFPTFV